MPLQFETSNGQVSNISELNDEQLELFIETIRKMETKIDAIALGVAAIFEKQHRKDSIDKNKKIDTKDTENL